MSRLQCDLALLSGTFKPGDSVVKSICDKNPKFTASSNGRIISESLTYSKVRPSLQGTAIVTRKPVLCVLVGTVLVGYW